MRIHYKIVLLVVVLAAGFWVASAAENDSPITAAVIASAEKILGIEFSPAERDSMLGDLGDNLKGYAKLRSFDIHNSIPPAFQFNPVPVGMRFPAKENELHVGAARQREVPDNQDALAFYSLRDLAELMRARKITSLQLTQMYLQRLKTHGPSLECVVTLTEDLALSQARKADEEIAAGKYRGFLHGIPYGVKDLLSVPGYKTTWGAAPYKDQMLAEEATVVKRLEAAGAILVAKLTLGALAWGDVWYGGKTRNPWDLEQGSSGSSAGPASATAAGLVAFSIGTETWGSIVSPSTRCGTTGLRPTYGRVSRAGAMALSWTMDKIGPICRTVEDCALVFDAIRGPDGIDQTVVDRPFHYDANLELSDLRIGYVQAAFAEDYPNHENDAATLAQLREMGMDLVAIELPETPVGALSVILVAEAAAAFDELTRSGRDDLMIRQIKNAWPSVFRSSRLIPAVEYIQANRLRYQIIQDMHKVMEDVDVYVCPSFGGNNLLLTNLTGHPCVVLPNGFDDEGHPASVTFMGRLFDEGTVLAVAKAYQDAAGFIDQHPPLFQ